MANITKIKGHFFHIRYETRLKAKLLFTDFVTKVESINNFDKETVYLYNTYQLVKISRLFGNRVIRVRRVENSEEDKRLHNIKDLSKSTSEFQDIKVGDNVFDIHNKLKVKVKSIYENGIINITKEKSEKIQLKKYHHLIIYENVDYAQKLYLNDEVQYQPNLGNPRVKIKIIKIFQTDKYALFKIYINKRNFYTYHSSLFAKLPIREKSHVIFKPENVITLIIITYESNNIVINFPNNNIKLTIPATQLNFKIDENNNFKTSMRVLTHNKIKTTIFALFHNNLVALYDHNNESL